MASIDEIRNERIRKKELLEEKGYETYPASTSADRSVKEFLASFDGLLSSQESVSLAGRIMSLRLHGGSAFADMFDGTGRIQIYLKKDDIGDEPYDLFVATVDASDFIEVSGVAFETKRGEKTLLVSSWRMLTKSLRPVPDEWYGIKDEDERYRRRYLDILLNEELADMIRKRSVFWNTIRQYLLSQGFIEVETPALENITGGADARPFVTHHNALDIDVYLRISAGELWQKKLLVAGLPKIFEIGRIFRNEGMSAEHLQDYTQLEFYMAYADCKVGMQMIPEMYRLIAQETFGTTKFDVKGFSIDLGDVWQTYDYGALMRDAYGINVLETTVDEVVSVLAKHEVEYDQKNMNLERGIDALWKRIRRTLGGPGFLVGVPVYMEPLAKRSSEDDRVVERFQVIIAGSEVGKGYSELNDPIDQRVRFEHQQALRDAGDEEAQMADMEFVEALEYGMPPALGFGLSERLFSFLMNKSVREAQIFPMMRPKG